MADERKKQAAAEAIFCETILAKSGTNVLLETLAGAPVNGWQHYPEGDVLDATSGAQWYYHSHVPGPENGEHGHFHCFLRPSGAQGPVHHLVAVAVDAYGRPRRLFTVNHWVVGDDFLSAEETIPLLARFDVQLARPDYLVNRWLTAIVALYEEEIAALIRARDAVIAAHVPKDGGSALEDRSLEFPSDRVVDLEETAKALGLGDPTSLNP